MPDPGPAPYSTRKLCKFKQEKQIISVPPHGTRLQQLSNFYRDMDEINDLGQEKVIQIRIRPPQPENKKRLEPGGRARIQAEVSQPAEQTHPELVEAAHLAVAGQVRQDLRLSNDRNCTNKKELGKIRDRKDIKGTVARDGYFFTV